MAAERRFRAMGSDAHVIVVGGPAGLADAATARVDDLERRWSRFLADSEISRLNRQAGSFVSVSSETVTLVQRAIDAWLLSGGAFDPTVLGDLVRAGYDRSFDLLGSTPPDLPGGDRLLGIGAADIAVDGNRIRLAPGTGFDPGGIGKGLAADLTCAELLAAGAEGACVNLGGDLRVVGAAPAGSWTVAIEHPWRETPVTMIGLADGAVATSTTLRRRWQADGQTRHHVIDPQTGLPSDTDVTLATVIASEAWIAEVLAKAVLLAGANHPFDILGGTGAHGLAVDIRGHVATSSGFAHFCGASSVPATLAA